MEIRVPFVNEKEKGSGRQADYHIRMFDITVSNSEVLHFSPQPGNKLSIGRFFTGFLSSCRASPIQHVSTKQAMNSATHIILISLIILYNLI